MVITQVSQFPKAKHDDLTDTVSMAINYMRRARIAGQECTKWTADLDQSRLHAEAAKKSRFIQLNRKSYAYYWQMLQIVDILSTLRLLTVMG